MKSDPKKFRPTLRHRFRAGARTIIPHPSIPLAGLIALATANLQAQEPEPAKGMLVIERSVEGGPWESVSPVEMRAIDSGRIWLPFLDRRLKFRLGVRLDAPGATRPLASATARGDGAFFEIEEYLSPQRWGVKDPALLRSDGHGFEVPLGSGRGYWRLKIAEIPPDPSPLPPLAVSPNPDIHFEEFPPPTLGSGLGGKIGEWDGPPPPLPSPGPGAFNQYIFEERVHQLFEGDVKGYGVVVANEDGFQGKVSGGWARDPGEGALRMTTFRPGNIGSTAKLYAGVALMRLLEAQGPNLLTTMDQTIAPYLPARWQQNLSATHQAITFRMLLSHTSGIIDIPSNQAPANRQDHMDYFHFTSPIPANTQGCYNYANENYRIMTYLIPRLAYPDAMQQLEDDNQDANFELYLDNLRDGHGIAFEQYMEADFFPRVAGNFDPSCDPANDYPAGTTALMYSSPNDTAGLQWSQKELTGFCRGQGGWWSTAQELARFMSSVMYTDDLVRPQDAQLLISAPGTVGGPCPGSAAWLITNGSNTHAGFTAELGVNRWRNKPGRQPSNTAPGGTGRAEAMFLPYGWVGAVVINSDSLSDPNGNSSATTSAILDGFFDATRDVPMTISREAMTVPKFLAAASELRARRMEVLWLDFHDIDGTPYVNAVFGAAPQPIAGQIGMNGTDYQEFLSEWVDDKGFAIQQVESYLDDGKLRYAAIITEDDRPDQRAYHGYSYQLHEQKALEWRDEGFVPINVSVVTLNGTRRYTAFYEKRNVAFQMRTQLTAEGYQAQFVALAGQGYRVVSLNAYWHDGVPNYAAIWHHNGGSQAGIHHALRDDYRAADATQLNGGRLPTIITGIDSKDTDAPVYERHGFGAIWE